MEKILTGKTLEEALENACNELNLKKDDFTYEMIEYPSRGFLGIGSKPAKIKVIYQISPEVYIKKYFKGLFDIMKITDYDLKIDFAEDKHINIQIDSEEASILTYKQSEAVESLQLILAMTINKLCNEHYKITFNVNDFKEKSIQRLEALSVKTANQVLKTHKRVVLNPMSAYQRRIVHSKLQDFKDITTYSVGEEPNRKVIISYQGPGGYQKTFQNPVNNTSSINTNSRPIQNNNTTRTELPFTNTNVSKTEKPFSPNTNVSRPVTVKPYQNNNIRPYAPRLNTNTNTSNKIATTPVKKVESTDKKPE